MGRQPAVTAGGSPDRKMQAGKATGPGDSRYQISWIAGLPTTMNGDRITVALLIGNPVFS